MTDQTRQAIDEYLRLTGRKTGQFLFAGRTDDGTRGLSHGMITWIISCRVSNAINTGTSMRLMTVG